jgi:hypothetical protein
MFSPQGNHKSIPFQHPKPETVIFMNEITNPDTTIGSLAEDLFFGFQASQSIRHFPDIFSTSALSFQRNPLGRHTALVFGASHREVLNIYM